MVTLALLPLVLAAVLPPQAPVDLQQELQRAVDLPTPAERRKAADALAGRSGVSVAQWQAACAAFGASAGSGASAALEPGQNRQTVELPVLDQVEKTEVFLFVPKNYDSKKPAPLLLWGHGAESSGAREFYAWEAVAEALGMLVLAPSEVKERGWAFTPRERMNQLAALRWARRQANVDENAVFVGGCSRGGHMTWDLGQRFPDLWAGMVPCIGGPRVQLDNGQNNLRYLENVTHVPIRDLQGMQDDGVLIVNLRLAFERLKKLGAADAKLVEFADKGHTFDLAAVDWPPFFAARRQPVPTSVVRLAAQPGETRAAWAEILAFDESVTVNFAPQVDPALWKSLDQPHQHAWMLDRAVDKTARLRVDMKQRGHFVSEARGVRKFRLLLTADMIADGKVEVRAFGKTVTRKVEPSASVLLREFVERFDRTFLPIAEVVLP
jgi:dienelactone hydrolase